MANQRPRASIHATPQTTFAYPQAKENTRDKWGKDKYAVKKPRNWTPLRHFEKASQLHRDLRWHQTNDGIDCKGTTRQIS